MAITSTSQIAVAKTTLETAMAQGTLNQKKLEALALEKSIEGAAARRILADSEQVILKKELTAQNLYESASLQALDAEKKKNLFSDLGLQETEDGLIISTKELTASEVEQAISRVSNGDAALEEKLKLELLGKQQQKNIALSKSFKSLLPKIGAGLAITSAVLFFNAVSEAANKTKEKVEELRKSYNDTEKDVNSYKSKIADLYKVINDSSSSIEQTTSAREQLIGIQDELIEKYGKEAGAIDNITEAINGEQDALDNITNTSYKKLMSQMSSTTNGGFLDDLLGRFGLATATEIGTYWQSFFDGKKGAGFTQSDLFENAKRQSFGFYDASTGKVSEEGYDFDLITAYQKVNKLKEDGIELTKYEEQQATDIISDYEQWGELYKKQIIYNHSTIFEQLKDINSEYQDAFSLKDETIKEDALKSFDKILHLLEINGKTEVISTIKEMYPSLENEISKWRFKIKFEADTDNVKSNTTRTLDTLNKRLFKNGTSKTDLIQWYNSAKNDSDNGKVNWDTEFFNNFQTDMKDAGFKTVEEYIDFLIEKVPYLVMSDNEKEFKKRFKDVEGANDFWNSRTDSDRKIIAELKDTDLIESLDDLKQAIINAKRNNPDYVKSLSNAEEFAYGDLDALMKIYDDVKNGEDFDYSSILNNEDFTKKFSGYDSYKDFIKTIANAPDDIEACQNAFDELATEALYASKTFAELDETSADATIRLLGQQGIANASELVANKLKHQNEENTFLEATTKKVSEATYEEIESFLNSSEAADIDNQSLWELWLTENTLNGNTIDTTDEVDNLINVASAAGIATEKLQGLSKIKQKMNQLEIAENDMNSLDIYGSEYADAKKIYENLLDEIQNKDLPYELANLKAELAAKIYGTVQTNGSYSGRNSDSSSESNPEEFNWIERAIQKVETAISRLETTANSVYTSWTKRNQALVDSLEEVTNEIDIQQQAADYYLNRFNSVEISEYYKDRIMNGAIDIEEINDEELAKQINKAITAWDDYQECITKVQELNETVFEKSKAQFDNLATQFEEQIDVIEKSLSMIEGEQDIIEAKGYKASSALYESMSKNTEKRLDLLEKEKSALEKSLDESGIEEGTTAWYEMYGKILDVDKAIQDANKSLIQYSNSLRQLKWDAFDNTMTGISDVISEIKFYYELLENRKLTDDYGLNENGDTAKGLIVGKYELYKQQAQKYADEIAEIDAQIANDPYNTTLLERRKSLIEAQRDSIKNVESEKKALVKLIQDGYTALADTIGKTIDDYKNLLSINKETYSYQKSMSEKTKQLSDYQKQLAAIGGDNSEEAMTRRQQLEKQIKDTQTDIQETEYDKMVSETEKLLDEFQNEFKDWITNLEDKSDQLLKESIDGTNQTAQDIYTTLQSTASEVGIEVSNSLSALFGGEGGENIFENTKSVIDTIADYVQKIYEAGNSSTQGVGWVKENGTWYYKNVDGSNAIGWQQLDDGNGNINWYNFDENGAMRTDSWIKGADGQWYHLGGSGAMDTNKWIENQSGTWSYVGNEGNALTGWQKLKDSQGNYDWYNFDKEGTMRENSWIDDYFVDKDGRMLSNTWIGHNGKYYWVGADGRWLDKDGWSIDGDPEDDLPKYEYYKGGRNINKNWGWTQDKGVEIVRNKDGALLTPVKGSTIFTNEMTNALWNFAKNPGAFINGLSAFKMPNITSNNSSGVNMTTGDFNIQVVANNPDEFANQMKKVMSSDKNAQKMIQQITLGQTLGQNSLNVKLYR